MSLDSQSAASISSTEADVQWGIHVELGPCRVVKDDKGKFTTFTFRFRIAQHVHEFTSRYSKIYKFHESLTKSEVFQKAFNYDPPKFPPKSWMTDYTKPKNYKKRANALLSWFEELLSKPLILRDKIFQKGIYLQKDLQIKMSQIAIDLQSRKRVIDIYDRNNYKKQQRHKQQQQHIQSIQAIQQQQQQQIIKKIAIKKKTRNDDLILNEKELSILLIKLQEKTDDDLIFCDEMQEENISMNEAIYDNDKLNEMNIFSIYDVLPSYLLQQDNINNTKFEAFEEFKEFKKFESEEYIKDIDNICYEIRDMILLSCDVIND